MIDLHTHSVVSDGSDQPYRIPELAAGAGCSAVALTDHDRLDGVPAAQARAAELGIRLVPGVELSCRHEGAMHLLGYFLEPGDGPLQRELLNLQRIRDERNRRMCEVLRLDYGELLAEAGGTGAGRPHAAAILVRQGRASSIADAFDRYLAKGRPGYVEKDRLEPAAALALVQASGGVAVLAHPLSLRLEPGALGRALDELAALGLAGVEAIYGRYSPEEREGLASLAAARGLVVSGGSDYHGRYKPDLRVGLGTGDLRVPAGALEELEARRP